MSFTNFYFNYGYNSALEKVAKDDDMSWAKKLGLGALGAGALGAGAYYGGDALQNLGELAAENASSVPMADAGNVSDQVLSKIAPILQNAGGSMNEARDAIIEAAKNAGTYGMARGVELRDAAADAIGKPTVGSPQYLMQDLPDMQ